METLNDEIFTTEFMVEKEDNIKDEVVNKEEDPLSLPG